MFQFVYAQLILFYSTTIWIINQLLRFDIIFSDFSINSLWSCDTPIASKHVSLWLEKKYIKKRVCLVRKNVLTNSRIYLLKFTLPKEKKIDENEEYRIHLPRWKFNKDDVYISTKRFAKFLLYSTINPPLLPLFIPSAVVARL